MATTTLPTITSIPPELPTPLSDPEAIAAADASLIFPHFTSATAWQLGSALRARLLQYPKPTVIDISLTQALPYVSAGAAPQYHCLFHATTHSGTAPDNDAWVARKRATVVRFGCSTWFLSRKFAGDEAAFAKKFSVDNSGFAIHGGGWPVRVRGVEGVVAVVVVSGLKQEQDHGVIVQVVEEVLAEIGEGELGEVKKKED